MKIDNESWPIAKVRRLKSRIDPKPQYQRGEVWSLPQQQLLIDSIINRFDIPKIYLRKTSRPYVYEVADGQQRLHAIWGFLSDSYPLGEVRAPHAALSGYVFSSLPQTTQKQILGFELIVSIVASSTNEEIRELFARLQKGVRLSPPELRNSIPSALGDVIRGMAETHHYFTSFPNINRRFQHDDLVAHAFAIELYGLGTSDLKAPQLASMYQEHSEQISPRVIARVNSTLNYLAAVQRASDQAIGTKWGFVDTYGVISKKRPPFSSAQKFAERYVAFEQTRLKNTAAPEKLLSRRDANSKQMYKYIVNFKTNAGAADSLRARHNAIAKCVGVK